MVPCAIFLPRFSLFIFTAPIQLLKAFDQSKFFHNVVKSLDINWANWCALTNSSVLFFSKSHCVRPKSKFIFLKHIKVLFLVISNDFLNHKPTLFATPFFLWNMEHKVVKMKYSLFLFVVKNCYFIAGFTVYSGILNENIRTPRNFEHPVTMNEKLELG